MRRSRSGDRIRRHWGRLLSVSEDEVTRRVLADQAAGENTLWVDNGYVFGDKGWCQVGDQVTAHTGWNEDTQILTLVDDLTAAVEEGDRVGLWNHARDALVVELTAEVERDGVRGQPLECEVDEGLLDSLPVGPRDVGEGEDVLVEHDPEQDSWTIIRTSGQARIRGIRFESDDVYTLTAADIAAGSATLFLTHRPVDESVKLWWRTVAQEPTEYTVNADAQTITLPLASFAAAGDRVWVHYAYRRGLAKPGRLSIPIGYSWKYANGLGSSTTIAAVDYDDSSWGQGPTPFGWGLRPPGVEPPQATAVPHSPTMDVWQRLAVTTRGGDLTFTSPAVDDRCWVYLDGVQIAAYTTGFPVTAPSFSVACEAGDHVIAVRGTEGNDGGGYSGWAIEEAT